MKENVKFIAFDADDTLWVNEPYFMETEQKFCALLEAFLPHQRLSEELFKTEMNNLDLYGYGIKGFVLSMIETAHRVTNGVAKLQVIDDIIRLGQELLQKPVELIIGVEEVLMQLSMKYKLMLATKGDLLDQKRKLNKSGLQDYFHHTEIMSDKKTADYLKLLRQLNCKPENFMMIGNSMKSDIFPVLEVGGYAAYIPYPIIWSHERHNEIIQHKKLIQLNNITEILNILEP